MLAVHSLSYSVVNNVVVVECVFYIRKPQNNITNHLADAVIKLMDKDTDNIDYTLSTSTTSNMSTDGLVLKTFEISVDPGYSMANKKVTVELTDSYNHTAPVAIVYCSSINYKLYRGNLVIESDAEPTTTTITVVATAESDLYSTYSSYSATTNDLTISLALFTDMVDNTTYIITIGDIGVLSLYYTSANLPAVSLIHEFASPVAVQVIKFKINTIVNVDTDADVNVDTDADTGTDAIIESAFGLNYRGGYQRVLTTSTNRTNKINNILSVMQYDENDNPAEIVASSNTCLEQSPVDVGVKLALDYNWEVGVIYHMTAHAIIRDGFLYITRHIKNENQWTYIGTTKILCEDTNLLGTTINLTLESLTKLANENITVYYAWAMDANYMWLEPDLVSCAVSDNILNVYNDFFNCTYDTSTATFCLEHGYNSEPIHIDGDNFLHNYTITVSNAAEPDLNLVLDGRECTFTAVKISNDVYIRWSTNVPYFKVVVLTGETSHTFYDPTETIVIADNANEINVGDTITVVVYDIFGGNIKKQSTLQSSSTLSTAKPTMSNFRMKFTTENLYMNWTSLNLDNVCKIVLIEGGNTIYDSGFTITAPLHVVQLYRNDLYREISSTRVNKCMSVSASASIWNNMYNGTVVVNFYTKNRVSGETVLYLIRISPAVTL